MRVYKPNMVVVTKKHINQLIYCVTAAIIALVCMITYVVLSRACAYSIKHSWQHGFDRAISTYVRNFSLHDFIARHLDENNVSKAIKTYKDAMMSLDFKELHMIARLRADLERVWPVAVKNTTYHCIKFDNTIENTYPHTHVNVICLPAHFFVTDYASALKTFVHEFVHVWQRENPEETAILLRQLGYKRYGKRKSHPLARSNPDLDDWTYEKNGHVEMLLYASSQPTSLADVQRVCYDSTTGSVVECGTAVAAQTEHPFEVMACVLADVLLKTTNDEPTHVVNVVEHWKDKIFNS